MKFTKNIHKQAYLTGVLSLFLFGCSVKEAYITPEGLLSVLGPSPNFTPENLPKDWIIKTNGKLNKSQIQIVTKNGKRSLKVTSAKDDFIIVRRTNAMMLATPFLSWSWLIEQALSSGYHPLRIIIGFYGGDPKSRVDGNKTFKWLSNSLPRHDRMISFTWGKSALQRGSLMTQSRASTSLAPSYTVRGGRENVGSWWLETVDVSSLYHQIWPKDNRASTRIVFIGIGAIAEPFLATAQFSDIKLSR